MRMLARKLPLYALTFVIAITIDFFIPRLMPGNALDAVLAKAGSQMGSPQALRALEKLYGIDNPASLPTQYARFWGSLLHGNLGVSTSSYPTPVTSVIATALPWTVALVGAATVISFVLGTGIGVLVAWRRGTWLDSLLPVTTFFQAAPYFFLAFLAIELFAVKLGWFPYGLGQNQLDYQTGLAPGHVADVLDHAALPALTIVVASAAGWMVGMRNQMLTTMDEDYVLIAQAKGLPKPKVVWYAARNAILPSVSGFSLADRVRGVRRAADRDRLLLPGDRLRAVPGGHQPRRAADAGHLPDHHDRRAGREPDRRLRLPDPRPAHPAGGVAMAVSTTEPAAVAIEAAAPLRARRLRLPRSPKVLIGLGLLIAFLVLAVIGPLIAPYNPSADLAASGTPQPPSAAHWLGTTQTQQDVLSQLLAGGRSTIVVAFLAGVVATVIAVVVGVTAGYLGGLADDLLSLLANIFLVMPALLLLIVIFGFLPASSDDLLIGTIIALTGWAWGARVLRAQTLSLRNRDFVESARITGESTARIIGWEIVPNLLPIIASSFLFTVLYGVGTYTAIAYLGLVNIDPHWSWGGMLFWAQSVNAQVNGYWWWYIPPGLAVALLGTALALLNFGIDEFINPRLRSAGLTRRRARQAGIPARFPLGVTPVVRQRAGAPAVRPPAGPGPVETP